MNHLGLFEGIGGFSLAARWMGWDTVSWCEINSFCQKVLKHHFPKAAPHSDIKQTDFTPYANRIDILTGGFPCQPYSTAGKRLGKEDDRHLWPEMLRAIREIKPVWVVGENVRGLTNWNGGMVFDEVQVDLENEGFEIIPFLLPACAVNAPHRRDRIWFIAYSKSFRVNRKKKHENGDSKSGDKGRCDSDHIGEVQQRNIATNTNGIGCRNEINRTRESRQPNKASEKNDWENFPTQPPICGGDDGIPRELDGITFSKWRNESIKAYGNAIVPQIALQIFKAIEQYNTNPSPFLL